MVSPQTTKNLVEIKNLSKRYKGVKEFALHNLTLSVAPGEVYGFLGSNGAGKSTTIRTLLNFIQPTGGQATILGYDIVRDSLAIKSQVGYLSGDVALYNKLTGKQFLAYMKDLQPVTEPSYLTKLAKNLQAELNKPLGDLSKGNRQKIGILQAFGHQPKVLILDEPTSGLDPLMQEIFFEAVQQAKDRGACVFFSSHNMAEVQRVCDRVGFIRKGKLIKEQSLKELAASAAHTFDLIFVEPAPVSELKQIPGAEVSQLHANTQVSVAVPANALSKLFAILANHKLQHFGQREVNLEEEFLNFYREGND